MLGMKESDENRHVFRVREFGEDDGKVLFTKEGEERLDLRDDVAGGRNFHRLAGIEEGALHVHDDESRLARLELQRLFTGLRPVHGNRGAYDLLSPRLAFGCASNYHAATENAFGMWRIALTPPSAFTTTATTSKRQGCSRRRLE